MPAATAIQEKKSKQKKEESPLISWEEFEREYLTREDGYRYEWVNGRVDKTEYTMNENQFFILRNLLQFYRRLLAEGKVNGELIPEGDMFFEGVHRRPDISWLTDEQIALSAYDENVSPDFIIEIISNRDAINNVQEKMEDYRRAGVKVVWHIFTKMDQVHVYGGKNLDTMKVCKGTDACSAAPVLPVFSLSVNDIFKKPAKPAK